MTLVNGSFCGKLNSILREKKIEQMHLLWHLQQVLTVMALRQKNVCAKIAITFLFFEILQKFFFPLLAKTFMLLIAKNQVDAANIELWGSSQMIRTTFCALCSTSVKKSIKGPSSKGEICKDMCKKHTL